MVFRLLFKLEVNRKKNLINYLRSIVIFIAFTLLSYIALSNLNVIVNSRISLEIYSILNIMVIGIIHYLIQKLFFTKLEDDVLLSFIPEKSYEYIKGRLFLVLLKWNMPFIIPCLLNLRKSFMGLTFIFYICSILFLLSWIIINYLIAIYVRYMINNLIGFKRSIFNIVMFFTYIVIMFIVPNIFGYNFLAKDEINIIKINNPIKISNYFIIIFMYIALIILVILKWTDTYFEKNTRFIIENKVVNNVKKFNDEGIFNKGLKIFLNICSIGLINIEKKLFLKDVKNFYRGSKKTFLFLICYELFSISFLLFMYYNSLPKNLEDIFNLFIMLKIAMIFIALMPAFLFGNFTLRNFLMLDKDMKLLKDYNIKVHKNILLNSKRRVSISILYSYIFIFYIIAFVTTINIWAWVGLLLSAISTVLIINLINLNLIKHLNKENSRNIIIRRINTLTLIGCVIVFKFLFTSEKFKSSILFYGAFNIILIVSYLFNYKVNITKEKREDKALVCCK